jgi:hypothetical protein
MQRVSCSFRQALYIDPPGCQLGCQASVLPISTDCQAGWSSELHRSCLVPRACSLLQTPFTAQG